MVAHPKGRPAALATTSATIRRIRLEAYFIRESVRLRTASYPTSRGDHARCLVSLDLRSSVDITHPPPIGRCIAGKYRLDRVIGRGGMGVVYAGRHELLDQPVAVKLLIGDAAVDPTSSARFLNEARAAACIPSDHVVRVLDVGLEEERPYFVMEYLEGKDLARLLEERGPLPQRDAVEYVLEAIEALAQAHALGIIHRDLKPSNLFLAERPDGSRVVKVLDFGIAKAFGPAAQMQAAAVTTQGLVGSPAYMAPEYVRSAKNIDTRADIWAIGVILYELLTGELPFEGENSGEVLAAILEKTPAPIASRRAGVSPELEAVVTKCLARKPKNRYAELADVAEALAPFATKRSPSIVRIRASVATLMLRPLDADRTGSTHAVGAGRDDPTEVAPVARGEDTGQSWTSGGAPATQPATRMAKAIAVVAAVAVAVIVMGVRSMRTATSAAPPAVGPSESVSPAPTSPPAISAPTAIATATETATTPSTPTSTPGASPAHHRRLRPWHPAPNLPPEPTFTRDRR
jgi:serine/threonine-protein kinase